MHEKTVFVKFELFQDLPFQERISIPRRRNESRRRRKRKGVPEFNRLFQERQGIPLAETGKFRFPASQKQGRFSGNASG